MEVKIAKRANCLHFCLEQGEDMAEELLKTEPKDDSKKPLVSMSDFLFGRRDIFATYDEITEDNVVFEVNTALAYHYQNVFEEEYLYWYRRGIQPVLHRTKEYNDWILNKVVVNLAEAVITFKNGYLIMEPLFYSSRGAANQEDIDQLNEYLYRSGKQEADNKLADWFHMVGKAALYVESNDDPDIPVKAYAIDPRSAFVVRSMRPGNKPVYAINVVIQGNKSLIDVYTKDKIFRLSGGSAPAEPVTARPTYEATAVQLEKVEKNELGHIPIIEYRYNSVNMGAFESVISILDAINEVQSNRVDGVAQFIQSLGVAINCNFDETVSAETIKRSGLIALSSIGENKADFKILSEELNQDQTQTLIDDLKELALTICSVPGASGTGTSASLTGQAAIFNNRWEQAAAAARNTEDLFRESNRYFDEILIDVLRKKGILNVKLVDFELNIVRNETANVQSKAQAAQTMLSMGMHPELAFKKSGLSNDPVADVQMSEKYLKLIWGDPDEAIRAEEEGDGQGEAIVIEEDNNNGENATGGA